MPRRRASRRPRHRRRRRTPPHAPRGCARPAGGTRAGSKRGWPRGSRRGRDSARAPARGRGSPAGRRVPTVRTSRSGSRSTGRKSPARQGVATSADRRTGPRGYIPAARRSPGIPGRRPLADIRRPPDEPAQGQAPHDQPADQHEDAGQPDRPPNHGQIRWTPSRRPRDIASDPTRRDSPAADSTANPR